MDEDSSNDESDFSRDYSRYWDPDQEQFVSDSDYAGFGRGDYWCFLRPMRMVLLDGTDENIAMADFDCWQPRETRMTVPSWPVNE